MVSGVVRAPACIYTLRPMPRGRRATIVFCIAFARVSALENVLGLLCGQKGQPDHILLKAARVVLIIFKVSCSLVLFLCGVALVHHDGPLYVFELMVGKLHTDPSPNSSASRCCSCSPHRSQAFTKCIHNTFSAHTAWVSSGNVHMVSKYARRSGQHSFGRERQPECVCFTSLIRSKHVSRKATDVILHGMTVHFFFLVAGLSLQIVRMLYCVR